MKTITQGMQISTGTGFQHQGITLIIDQLLACITINYVLAGFISLTYRNTSSETAFLHSYLLTMMMVTVSQELTLKKKNYFL